MPVCPWRVYPEENPNPCTPGLGVAPAEQCCDTAQLFPRLFLGPLEGWPLLRCNGRLSWRPPCAQHCLCLLPLIPADTLAGVPASPPQVGICNAYGCVESLGSGLGTWWSGVSRKHSWRIWLALGFSYPPVPLLHGWCSPRPTRLFCCLVNHRSL